MVSIREGAVGSVKRKGIKKYQLVVTEQSQGCEVQHREYSQWCGDNYSARWVLD